MEKQLGLYSKNEVEFNMEGLDKSNIEDVTITMPGYIILPNEELNEFDFFQIIDSLSKNK